MDGIFDSKIAQMQEKNEIQWVDSKGNPLQVSGGRTANDHLEDVVTMVQNGEVIGNVEHLVFRDPNKFRVGELHQHQHYWQVIASRSQSSEQEEVLQWIQNKVSIFPFLKHFKGSFKGEQFDSDRPPHKLFRNNVSCKPFADFIRKTLLDRLRTGAISLVGRVGQVNAPHIVLPLTIEPTKPRLCHDARYLNLWMKDKPFSLDKLTDLPRYVFKDSYQTVLDDKSGYDHVLLSEDSVTYFGIQWSGWYFTYNTLPFGWKISPYVYHSTGLMAANFFRSLGIPCLLYIDDRHNGQLQVSLDKGEYRSLETHDQRNLAAAKSAIFLVVFHLIRLGYFLGLSKSILTPQKVVPYLGFMVDSLREVFLLIPEKQKKFVELIYKILQSRYVSVKTLQRISGKCVSFALAIPQAQLFTREMNNAISVGLRTLKPIPLKGELRDEIAHWLFLEGWDDPLHWRDEKHFRVKVASDASRAGWGGIIVSPFDLETSDYWSEDELSWDIATKEAEAINRVLLSFSDHVRDSRVDMMVDNQAVIHVWNNHGGRSRSLNTAIKNVFFTTLRLNILLRLSYVPSQENPADLPSRRVSSLDSKLSTEVWEKIQREFGGEDGHSIDLMALDSNVMIDKLGHPLPHFTPHPSPLSLGVNFFAQDLSRHAMVMQRPYIFPPLVLVGAVLRFLRFHRQSYTIVVLDIYPRKYWWPLLQYYSTKAYKLALKGDPDALVLPSNKGWIPFGRLPGDLCFFSVVFP